MDMQKATVLSRSSGIKAKWVVPGSSKKLSRLNSETQAMVLYAMWCWKSGSGLPNCFRRHWTLTLLCTLYECTNPSPTTAWSYKNPRHHCVILCRAKILNEISFFDWPLISIFMMICNSLIHNRQSNEMCTRCWMRKEWCWIHQQARKGRRETLTNRVFFTSLKSIDRWWSWLLHLLHTVQLRFLTSKIIN
jgi:hypothetical protein